MKSDTSIPPMAKKRVAVIIGRFNPPTRGHYAIIDSVKAYVRKHPDLHLEASPAVVVIGGNKAEEDKSRNPLSQEDRIKFMQASGRANGVNFFLAPDIMRGFEILRDNGLEPIVVAAGSDRVSDYLHILNTYFTQPDGKKIKHFSISLARTGDAIEKSKSDKDAAVDSILNSKNFDTDKISGSLARRAVELGYEPEFAKIVGLERKPVLAKKMFNKIKASLDG
jgi:hypothetical protein